MRCDICGTEYFGGDGTCPGCGYSKRSEDRSADTQTPFSGAAMQDLRPASVIETFKRTTVHTPQQIKRAKVLIICSIVFFAVVMVVISVLVRIDLNYDFDSFTIDLPSSMKEDSSSKFVSFYQTHGAVTGDYTNKNVRFAYAVFDIGNGQISSDALETAVNTILDSFTNNSGFEQFSRTADTVKFRMNNEGSLLYCQFRVVAEKGKLYYLLLASYDSQRSKYEKKFDKYMASFKTK